METVGYTKLMHYRTSTMSYHHLLEIPVLKVSRPQCTVPWEMFVVKIFMWGRRVTKIKRTNICVHLIIVGCHEPRQYFNTKILNPNDP